jgi:hypothetical protein
MRRITILFFLGTLFLSAFSQDENLQLKLDSIIAEADLMYKYEKAVWNSTDLLMADKKLKKYYGGYVVRHSGDSIFVTYFDKNQKECIARFKYIATNLNKPNDVIIESSPLSVAENELLNIKSKMLNQLSDSKYNVTTPQEFKSNFVLIKEDTIYKLYLIMGTSKSGVIPFGNDYLFIANSKGEIINWKKFHSRMIPTMAEFNGQKVTESSHSHLRTTPFITATDICTFRLYVQFTELEKFSVYSPAIGKTMTYILKTNKIEIK